MVYSYGINKLRIKIVRNGAFLSFYYVYNSEIPVRFFAPYCIWKRYVPIKPSCVREVVHNVYVYSVESGTYSSSGKPTLGMPRPHVYKLGLQAVGCGYPTYRMGSFPPFGDNIFGEECNL